MTTNVNMLLLFQDEEIISPPPETKYILSENGDQIVTEDGLLTMISE